MKAILIIFFVVIIFWTCEVRSQSCESVEPVAKVVPLCAKYFNESTQNDTFFVPQGPTKWMITAILSQAALTASRSISLSVSSCQDKLLPYVCKTVIKP